MNETLLQRLQAFQREHKITQKGALSVMLYVSRVARREGLPLDPRSLRTAEKGQVRGLGRSAVQAILRDYGITRTLAREGGRTSRGSLGLMEAYVTFLNQLNREGLADAEAIERWWVEQVRRYFASQPFVLRRDRSKSLQAMLEDLFEQVRQRQEQDPGATYLGSVLQHLVGAKLELALETKLPHHGAAVADASSARQGDFVIHNAVIHVTTAPSQGLLEKCMANLQAGLAPIIITLQERVIVARGNAEMLGIGERVDILAIEQFLTTNLHEWSGFQSVQRDVALDQLIDRYNAIVDACETDPSLRIRLGR
ncbi:MAG: DUF4928 domain-containing protein [Chloroflexi bacterium]|nr:DUF4928 domain-containing protein [Chloroflexota bacterium]